VPFGSEAIERDHRGTYEGATGLLERKTYDDDSTVAYTYTPDGRLIPGRVAHLYEVRSQ